jgi:hypothetical protein
MNVFPKAAGVELFRRFLYKALENILILGPAAFVNSFLTASAAFRKVGRC